MSLEEEGSPGGKDVKMSEEEEEGSSGDKDAAGAGSGTKMSVEGEGASTSSKGATPRKKRGASTSSKGATTGEKRQKRRRDKKSPAKNAVANKTQELCDFYRDYIIVFPATRSFIQIIVGYEGEEGEKG